MQNKEHVLSNYHLIYEMLNVGLSVKQITLEINKILNIQITYRQLRYLINRVQNRTIHREYDNIIMINSLNDGRSIELSKYCINFKGLLITYKAVAHLSNPAYTITPDNFLTSLSKESLLYAKRILKLYHVPDTVLLHRHKLIYPQQPDIDLKALTDKIYVSFNDEFNTMLLDLRKKYVHFIINNLQEQIDAKTKNL